MFRTKMGGIEAFKNKLEKVNIEFPYDQAIPKRTENTLNKYLYMNVHNSIIYISYSVETTHMRMNR